MDYEGGKKRRRRETLIKRTGGVKEELERGKRGR